MMKCSRLNTMETFKNGFSIERDGKVYTLTEEEMFDNVIKLSKFLNL